MVTDFENMTANDIAAVPLMHSSSYQISDDAATLAAFGRGGATFLFALTQTTIWVFNGERIGVHGSMIQTFDPWGGSTFSGSGFISFRGVDRG